MWVFADGQSDAIPERDGVPLNAVEFQQAIASADPALKLRSASGVNRELYIGWVSPYLYYFDFGLDQRWYGSGRRDGMVMLVPVGAKQPKVFQRRFPIENCTYFSDPEIFYAAP